ncbi:MAG: preprotein translocase subunit SecA [Christensenellales bacterium]|jgi:preprotein translocase subunit SecA
MSFFEKLFGGGNDKEIKRLNKSVDAILALDERMQALSDEALKAKTAEFRQRYAKGETLDALMVEAFAVLREASWRAIGIKQFPVQLLGGIVLHQGRIAEMKTGEGKTYVAPLAAYLNAIPGGGVHVVTVNDYLAKYQGEMISKVFAMLDMKVGLILHDMDSKERQQAYGADITYGTNNEFGFDYLRDNMVIRREEMVQRPLNFAIIDEVDSILIDEARTPLIISGAGEKSTELYTIADRFAARLKEEEDYTQEEKKKAINLTEEGVRKAEQFFSVDNLTDVDNTELNHHIMQALKARYTMKRDRDYVVQNGEVIIVDEFTGRLMTGRRYSEGLHQAIEAKEGVKIARESRTLATITFQNYFRMYKKLSGMTGTAKTEEAEFKDIYALDVVCLPTNKPMIRKDLDDEVYRNTAAKYEAVVKQVIACHEQGQPVLVGTVSVEKSELLSDLLKKRGVAHVVLNAKYHEKEAEIVAQAGQFGAVTIATNMAGRGTDILLGGNPDLMARREMRALKYEPDMIEQAISRADTEDPEVLQAREVYRKLLAQFKQQTDAEHEKVVAVGGLYIIGTERHESRRIDNQLRGRAGRQGDPGCSKFFIALDDDLMRMFGGDRIQPMLERINLPEDEPIAHGLLTKQIENAQKRVETRNFETRKSVLQFDDVMNQQREVIYSQRRKVLMGEDLRGDIMGMLATLTGDAVATYTPEKEPYQWDLEGLKKYLAPIFLPEGSLTLTGEQVDELTRDSLTERLVKIGQDAYAQQEQRIGEAGVDMREVERVVMLRVVDRKWTDHIDAMDQLRQGIGLRAYGQRDPVVEYRKEGYDMFEQMIVSIQADTLTMLYHVRAEKVPERRREVAPISTNRSDGADAVKKPAQAGKKVGRNDPCPCGSGKKYKNCCGRNA